MSFLTNFYNKTIEENERNLRFWEDYLQNLKSLDFKIYSDKLTVPVLVPIGSRILFRGDIKHTNEVTVSLGADYFAKCSLKKAEVLRQHRIKDAHSKVDVYRTEKEYLENQISFSKQHFFEPEGQEIVEVYTEEEDKTWRKKHRENTRKYKQASKNEETTEDVNDEELWQRLEELELQEELENELQELNSNEDLESNGSNESFIVKEEEADNLTNQRQADEKGDSIYDQSIYNEKIKSTEQTEKTIIRTPQQTSKLDLLQQVIDRQNEIGNRLNELKNREKSQTKTENDILSRLDEMEQLEDIEDEIDRLDDVLESEDIQETVEEKASHSTSVKRQVTFADNDDSETLHLSFHHSDADPENTPYDAAKGIQKPSDIYEAYPNSLRGSTSILKKSKYEVDVNPQIKILKAIPNKKVKMHEGQMEKLNLGESENQNSIETIIIKDVKERIDQNDNKLENETRPASLFKKKRMQKKS